MNKNNNTIDNLDKKIIKQLKDNGRKSYREIAKELNVSVGTITNRVQKLEKKGIINGFKLDLNYEKLGYNIKTIIELNITGEIDQLIKEHYQNIITAHKTTGEYDTIIFTRFHDTMELNEFLKILSMNKDINKICTQLIIDTF